MKVWKFEIDCWFLLLFLSEFYFILCMFCIFVGINLFIFCVKNYDCFMFILFSFIFFLVKYLILLMFCYIMYWPTDNSDILRHYSELCWASGCESRCAMLSHWLWIIVCFAEPVVVNHCELCWASGRESRVLFWAIDCESL